MPSVETQTEWSWLQDLKEIARLRALGSKGGDENWREGTGSPDDSVAGESIITTTEDDHESIITTAEDDHEGSAGGGDATIEPQFVSGSAHNINQSEVNADAAHTDSAGQPQQHRDIILSTTEAVGTSLELGNDDEQLTLPPAIVQQLEEIDFVSESNSSSDENDSKHQEDDPPKISDIHARELPWPAILQYLRESESLASKYFSLENRHRSSTGRRSRRSAAIVGHSKGAARQVEARTRAFLPEGGTVCEFCGQVSPRHSLLKGMDKDLSFCCDEYKEFCLLAAAYLRQMVAKRLQERPKKIAVNPTKKRVFKKTAGERALAMMRRKKRWEEMRRKRMQQLQSSSFYSLTKQTKTIQFSLLSPNVDQTSWMVRPNVRHEGYKKAKRRVRKEEEDEELRKPRLPVELIEKLKQIPPPQHNLDIRHYRKNHPFATVLPDRTGQCYYPSGELALVAFSPYPGVLGYLVYTEGIHPQLLAYLDEVGRACCYNHNGSLRLLFTPSHGTLYDERGQMRNSWLWRDNTLLFQPITLTLNRHVSLRCSSQDNITLTFSAPPHYIKFNIGCKIKHDSLPALRDKETDAMKSFLQDTQTKIGYLLEDLQTCKKAQRLSQLQSVYAPRGRIPTDTRKRTRSTGTIPLQKPPMTHTTLPMI